MPKIDKLVQWVRILSDEYIKRRAAVPASLDDIEEARKSISAVVFIVY